MNAFLRLRLSWLPLHSTYRIFSLDTEFWVDSSFLSTLKNMVPLLLAWETLSFLNRAGRESWLSVRPPLIPSLWGGEEYCSLYCWWGGKPGAPVHWNHYHPVDNLARRFGCFITASEGKSPHLTFAAVHKVEPQFGHVVIMSVGRLVACGVWLEENRYCLNVFCIARLSLSWSFD